ncbi:MAG: RNA pseudouridine synthase [Ruminococcaceae bacterium]|nr:RNA pseudouridine synthase [Oscillospiraceae bacterium]
MIEFLHKTRELVVIYKPCGIPTQSDTTGDDDAMSIASRELRTMGEASDLWLVHRLDRVVGGVLVFARKKSVAAELSALVGGRGMEKEYIAVVEGRAEGGVLTDWLYKDSKKGKAFVVSERRGAKKAELEYEPLGFFDNGRSGLTLVKIKLYTGRFHQIRAQFSSRGMSLVGDGKYGSHDNKAKFPALFASRISFSLGDKKTEALCLPDLNTYPWSLFEKELYQ